MMMERVWKVAIAAGLLSFAFLRAGAQEILVKPGSTVRFQIDSSQSTHSAELARLTSDSLFLVKCATCTRLLYSRTEVSRLAVLTIDSRGDRMLYGFAIGAIAGGVLGYIATATCKGGDRCDGAILAIPFGGIFGGLVGTTAGLFSAYKWSPIGPHAR